MSYNTKKICLKCDHDINLHKVQVIGNYFGVEIICVYGDDGTTKEDRQCGCDAGFHKVIIKKEFTSTS